MFPLGTKEEDLIGKSALEIVPNLRQSGRYDQYMEVIRTGTPLFFDELVPHPRFGDVYLEVKVFRVGDGLGIITVDVTQRKQAEATIRTLSSAVEQSMDGIAIADLESKLFHVNGAYARLYGYTRDAMIGMNLKYLCCKEPTSECKVAIQQIQTQGSWTGEAEHIRKDGTTFPGYISVTLLHDDSGKAAGTLVLCRDMTELRQQAEELTKFRAQMARAEQLASLGTLSATVAHQIVQPLKESLGS